MQESESSCVGAVADAEAENWTGSESGQRCNNSCIKTLIHTCCPMHYALCMPHDPCSSGGWGMRILGYSIGRVGEWAADWREILMGWMQHVVSRDMCNDKIKSVYEATTNM